MADQVNRIEVMVLGKYIAQLSDAACRVVEHDDFHLDRIIGSCAQVRQQLLERSDARVDDDQFMTNRDRGCRVTRRIAGLQALGKKIGVVVRIYPSERVRCVRQHLVRVNLVERVGIGQRRVETRKVGRKHDSRLETLDDRRNPTRLQCPSVALAHAWSPSIVEKADEPVHRAPSGAPDLLFQVSAAGLRR